MIFFKYIGAIQRYYKKKEKSRRIERKEHQ